MEKQNKFKDKIKSLLEKKSLRYGFALFVIGGLGAGGFFIGKPVAVEIKDSAAVKSFQENGVIKTYTNAFFSIIHKLDDLEKLDRTNAELTKRLAVLEKDYEAEKSKNVEQESKEVTEVLSEKLRGEAGSELARVLQSIDYQPPSHLLPHQQYTLALGYFRKQEYEQAAVLFTYLTELKEDTSYQRPEVYLMNAISWYKLKHYKLSTEYVNKTIKKSDDDTAVHRKAILWQAVLAKVQGDQNESQRILTSLVARYPHSEEVAWVNRRAPASSSEKEAHFAAKKHVTEEAGKKDESSEDQSKEHGVSEEQADHGKAPASVKEEEHSEEAPVQEEQHEHE